MKAKRILKFLGVLAVVAIFTGCYKHVPEEAAAPVEVKEVDLHTTPPSRDEADLFVVTHLKKRLTEEPHTFTIGIDGKEIKESVKGVRETESNVRDERGLGTHFALTKRLRLKPGTYEISLKLEDGRYASTRRELTGGNVYTVIFNPIYGPLKFARPKDFREGLVDFDVNFVVGNHLWE